jgi:adenylate cyclase
MTLLSEIEAKVDGYLVGQYKKKTPQNVPLPEEVPLGNEASVFEASTLFIDVRQSTDLTDAFRRQTAAKMMKAYFDGCVRIVNANDGAVRSFNGDGLLALFIGDSRSSNATKAAMQVDWFVTEVLGEKFEKYFANNMTALGKTLSFEIGCGLDDGWIYAVRVGIKGTNDVAWVGKPTNTAAKLSDVGSGAANIIVTRAVYNRLKRTRKYSNGTHMWSDETFVTVGGVRRAIRKTTWRTSL